MVSPLAVPWQAEQSQRHRSPHHVTLRHAGMLGLSPPPRRTTIVGPRPVEHADMKLTTLPGLALIASVLLTAPVAAQSLSGVDSVAEGSADETGMTSPLIPARTQDIDPAAEGLYVEFGRGVRLSGNDDRFALTIRGRVQTRATWRANPREPGVEEDDQPEPHDLFFEVRRARLVLLGDLPDQNLQLYIQLGLSSGDLDNERPVPLRDAVVTWTPLRDLNVRVGQMKVNYSRERVISSSALQFADRTIVNAEFNLDRDIGMQLFSNDLFGLDGRLGWQFGIYNGDGRNRGGTGTGLLYVGRLQVNPTGAFPDALVEADLSRSRRARLSLGVTGAHHPRAERVRTNQGALIETGPSPSVHFGADLLFKVAGFSLQTEWLSRTFQTSATLFDAANPPAASRSGMGGFVQTGYVFRRGFELAARYARIWPTDQDSSLVVTNSPALALGQYFLRHDLKLQADYSLVYAEDRPDPVRELRIQLQIFF